jgi:methylmalonyl-CoA/ethylmalonyl-CoA epimerase
MTQFEFHHLGVAVPDIAKAIPLYTETLGFRLTSGPYDDPVQEATVCFLQATVGPMVIELIAPLGAESKIRKILTQGGGAYHICYQVPGLDAVLRDLAAKQWMLVSGPTPAVAFAGRRIAWLYAPTRQLIELVEK